jgi:hypothetical protein
MAVVACTAAAAAYVVACITAEANSKSAARSTTAFPSPVKAAEGTTTAFLSLAKAVGGTTTAFPLPAKAAEGSTMAFPSLADTAAKVGTATITP